MGIMTIDLSGQTAVVFGAGKGIGATVAKELARAGAHVYLASRTEANCIKVMKEIISDGYQATAIACDVKDINQIDAVLEKAEAETNRLDIVINNAGIDCVTPFIDCSQEEIMNVIMTNQLGVNNGLQCALRRMKKYNAGKIVSTTSFAGRRDLPHELGFGHYGMAKAAVNYMTQSAAFAGADYNINVNAVGPGIVLTKMWEDILDTAEKEGKNREKAWEEYLRTYIPLARGAQTHEDIAYMIVFLCSRYADHITGQIIYVDGGASVA
ncbi:MAG: SDR family oxidoreductase [Clostridiales bacterium]|nr:SDR family oxidoreductase [Clostridiales bacterium]